MCAPLALSNSCSPFLASSSYPLFLFSVSRSFFPPQCFHSLSMVFLSHEFLSLKINITIVYYSSYLLSLVKHYLYNMRTRKANFFNFYLFFSNFFLGALSYICAALFYILLYLTMKISFI